MNFCEKTGKPGSNGKKISSGSSVKRCLNGRKKKKVQGKRTIEKRSQDLCEKKIDQK